MENDDMSLADREFYNDGQAAAFGEANPYDRYTQIRAFHGWSAGYYDKWGELPK